MENSGCKWDKQEDIQLTKLFKTNKMDIHEIAQIHRRSLEAIKLRLIKLNLIQENEKVNEYVDCNIKLLNKVNNLKLRKLN